MSESHAGTSFNEIFFSPPPSLPAGTATGWAVFHNSES